MKRFKIAVYYNFSSGGAKIAIENIIKGLKKRGHRVDIYSGESFHSVGISKKYGARYLLPFNLLRYKRFSKKIASKINKGKYDVAIITNSKILQHPYILRYIKIPKLLISQEPLRSVYEKNLTRELVYKKYYQGITKKFGFLYFILSNFIKEKPDRENLKQADQLIVNSYFSKENFLSSYGVLGKVVYPGVDTEIFKPDFEEKRENSILSIGIYHPIKAQDLVIKALSLIPEKKRPSLKILGFGNSGVSGMELQYLKNLRNKLGLQKEIEFNTFFLGKDIIRYYQKAYLTISAHFLEPFGLTPIESMACGTPVVAVREGGFRETVKHGKTGLLVERDPKKLADAILYLIENKEVWKRFSENGIRWVRSNFSWETATTKVEKEILKLYNKTINSI